jgi:hypothetical protein
MHCSVSTTLTIVKELQWKSRKFFIDGMLDEWKIMST